MGFHQSLFRKTYFYLVFNTFRPITKLMLLSMKIAKLALIFLSLTHFAMGQSLAQEKQFTVPQLQADLQFYKSKLEQYHPNLYLYTSRQKINLLFDSLNTLITKPLTTLEFYRIITLTSSAVKDGHTLLLPGAETTTFHNANSKFLPLQLMIANGELYTKLVCTHSKSIPEGAKILTVNGTSSQEVLQELSNRQVRDGKNLSYTYWILDNYFREYYSYVFGHPEQFEIEYERDFARFKTTIPALKKDSIVFYRTKNYPDVSFSKQPKTGITLSLNPATANAILTIKDFHNAVLKADFQQDFTKTISSYFDTLIQAKTKNLILDLRNNQGGEIENGVFLLSYLLKEPFRVVNGYYCMKSGSLAPCTGPSSGVHQARKNVYEGKLYVLTNGGSFSNSAIVSSCLKRHQRAIFVGSETGGNPNVLAGFGKSFELPNTKIAVDVPAKQLVMTSIGQNTGEGLKPHHIVPAHVADRVRGIDTELNFALKLLQENSAKH